MAKTGRTHIRTGGGELTHQHHETDSPLLAVEQLERLNKFKAEAVDWVILQTEIEANHRRKQENRINLFIFWERFLGLICALVIGLFGIGIGSWLVAKGLIWGASIACIAIVGLVTVFARQNRDK